MTTFDLTIAKSLYASEDAFPVDFDAAYKWCGYTRKENALKKLISGLFVETLDYQITPNHEMEQAKAFGAKPLDKYYLTVDGFKHFAMLAKTSSGKKVRSYFIHCEKLAKESAHTIAALQAEITELKAINGNRGLSSEVAAIWTELGPWSPPQAQLLTDRLIAQAIGTPVESLEPATSLTPAAIQPAAETQPEEKPLEVEAALRQDKKEKKEPAAKSKRGRGTEERRAPVEEPLTTDRVRLKSPKNSRIGFVIVKPTLPIGTSAYDRYQIAP